MNDSSILEVSANSKLNSFPLTECTERGLSPSAESEMASSKSATPILIAFAFVSFFIFNYSEGTYSPSASHVDGINITKTAFDSQKVNLSVYYESLSPSSATFIIKNLEEIFNRDLIKIVNLQLFPWANAHFNSANNSITCQNGPDECELNSLEACILNVWHDVNIHYGLIYCLEFLAIEGRYKSWQDCFSQLDLPQDPILSCHSRGNETELGRKYINLTAQLYPPHTFLPWVVVNNQPIGKDYANFVNYVCKGYKGINVPGACKVLH